LGPDSAGHLWHGGRTLDRTLETLWWEATQVAETLGFGPDLRLYPVLCVHVTRLSWFHELLVDGRASGKASSVYGKAFCSGESSQRWRQLLQRNFGDRTEGRESSAAGACSYYISEPSPQP
jgi:hypothetical protein